MRLWAGKVIRIARVMAVTLSALTPTGTVVRAQAEREFLRSAQAAKMLADSRPELHRAMTIGPDRQQTRSPRSSAG